MGKTIGIDLGTTNSVVAVMEGADVKVITNPSGSRTTPSVVGFRDTGERLVGSGARNQSVTNPENTVYSVKRFMGRKLSEVADEAKLIPYRVSADKNGLAQVDIRGESFAPPQISAMVLGYLKSYAEDYLGEPVTDAVITVPAYFNDAQRQATKAAGEIAGLNVNRIINEPTAAALAYSLDKKIGQKILVFDLGGGTFDVSVLEVGDGTVQVRSTSGDTHLGGDDYDQALMEYVCVGFEKQHKVDLRQDRLAIQRLKEACEKAKCELSSSLSTTINQPFIASVKGVGQHLVLDITRAKFEEITAHLTEKCRKPVEAALKDAKLEPKDIDEVVLVGGSIRMPAVQELVKKMFGKEPNRSVNPDEVVAIGAAIQGAIITGERGDILLVDVTPLSLGIETHGGVMEPIIRRNATVPTQCSQTFTNVFDNQNKVEIKVYQGDRKFVKDNRLLGNFILDGLTPAPKHGHRIDVIFEVDVNGIVKVTAEDQKTHKRQQVTIQAGSGLSKADIERMKLDAEINQAADEKRHAFIELQNKADSVVANIERASSYTPLDEDEMENIRSLVSKVQEAKSGTDHAVLEAAIKALEEAASKTAASGASQTPADSPAAESASSE